MNVALFYGGPSAEHTVSIHSAMNVERILDKLGHAIIPIAIDLNGHWLLQDRPVREAFATDREVSVHPGEGVFVGDQRLEIDVAFPVTHGHGGEDGQLQGLCALCGIPLASTDTLSSAVMMYKAVAQDLFRQAGIPTIPTYIIQEETVAECISEDDWPTLLDKVRTVCGPSLLVKPEDGGSSIGVTPLSQPDPASFADAVLLARRYGERILAQQLITPMEEVECALLEDPFWGLVASPPGLVVDPGKDQAKFLTYQIKYAKAGGDHLICPAPMPVEDLNTIMRYAKTAFVAAKCHLYARADFFYHEGTIWINEVNTLPGLTETSHYPVLIAQNGYTMEDVVSILLEDALDRYRKTLEKWYVPPT
jgi:D-alanine-D-alanine ligase